MNLLSQLSFQNVLHRLSDMIFIVDVEKGPIIRYVFANEAVYKKLGTSPDQLLGKTLQEVYEEQPERGYFILKKYHQVIEKRESLTYCDQFKDCNGKKISAETQIDPLINKDGTLTHLVATVRDISQIIQQQAEIAKKNIRLQKIEYHYHSLIENNNDAVWFSSKTGEIQHANKVCFDMLGVSSDTEMLELKASVMRALEPKELGKINKYIELVMKGNSQEFELYFYQKNGNCIDLNLKAVPVKIDGEIQGYYGIAKDVTKQKQLEKELRESEKRYKFIAKNAKDLIQIITKDRKVVYASPSYRTILGFTPKEIIKRNVTNDIHPDDLYAVKQKFNQIMATHETQVGEFRRRHKRGHWVWLETIATPVLDDYGNLNEIVMESRDITERKCYREELQQLAFHDALTNVANRRLFTESVEESLKESRFYGQTGSIMYLDLDKFKQINDTMGHDVGDELLKEFTERIKGCLRQNDTLARMGGDEFTILLPETDKVNAKIIANRILQAVQVPYHIKGRTISISSSIGISVYPEHGENAEDLIKFADEALYEAKRNGGNGIFIADK
jgi:diguanylate cyclase (GGDEF)-like protein/PAS domain S-box-containing protein